MKTPTHKFDQAGDYSGVCITCGERKSHKAHAPKTATHTPGPWKAKSRFCAHKFFAQHNYLIPIEHPTSGYVAYVSANDFSPDSDANAALIAAAPDMLKELNRLHDSIHRIKNEGLRYICDTHPAGCETRAALAAAEGRK